MMKLTRSGLVSLVFLAGCAVGGASSQFVVPKANAQNVQRWDYFCIDTESYAGVNHYVGKAKQAGSEGWEMVTGMPWFCFKRPM